MKEETEERNNVTNKTDEGKSMGEKMGNGRIGDRDGKEEHERKRRTGIWKRKMKERKKMGGK